MKIAEVVTHNKKGVPRIRYTLDVTQGEALLLKESLDALQVQNGAPGLWDCYNDPIVVAQMSRRMEAIN